MQTTTNDFELISDLHKEARGFRPSSAWFAHFDTLTYAEKEAVWDGLIREADASRDEEEARERAAVEDFRKLLQMNIDLGARTMENALRWVLEAYEDDDLEYVLWKNGILNSRFVQEVLSWGVGYEYRGGRLRHIAQ